MNKRIIVSAVATALMGPAAAYATCPKPALQFFTSDTGIIGWQSPRLDSPLDSNTGRLEVHVLNQDGDDWAGAYNTCTGVDGKLVGEVRNLSFDFLNDTGNPDVHIGAGAPRYSVDIDANGDTVYDFSAFMSAFYCQDVLFEDTRWSRADFTGRTAAGCSIFVDNVQYTSDGSKSAWKLYAEANPTHRVLTTPGSAYLVMDEAGTAFVDRLAFHNKMFVRSGTGTAAIKTCGTEAAC
jgi:hypothetical protein